LVYIGGGVTAGLILGPLAMLPAAGGLGAQSLFVDGRGEDTVDAARNAGRRCTLGSDQHCLAYRAERQW
jgi:hypothetical protein